MCVVIPTHNRCDVVGRAVASVLAQDTVELELIVVDDGSADETRNAVEAFGDDRVVYLAVAHRGASVARNVGAQAGHATWLTFLDSDDTAQPDWLSSLLAETRIPGTGLVSCGYAERVDGSNVVRRLRLPRRASPSVGSFVELIATGGSYMVRRDLFLDVGGFDPEQRAAQHQELALRLGPLLTERAFRSGAVMRPLINRWVGRDDHIRSNDQAVFEGSVRILERHRERLALDPPLLANMAATAAFRAVRLGRFADARHLMLVATRADPRNPRHWARLAALIAPRTAQRYAVRRHEASAPAI